MSCSQKYIYFVMPGLVDPLAHHKRQVILEVCTAFGISVRFPAFNPDSLEFNLDQEKDAILSSAGAIVDLSFERPSCYYELGLIECLGVPAFLICGRDAAVHQTMNRSSVVRFDGIDSYRSVIRDLVLRLRA